MTGRWSGATVVCIASGPSLTDDDVEIVRRWREANPQGRRVVVTCTTFRKSPWADALYAADARWWRVYGDEAARTFAGERWTCSEGVAAANYIEAVDEPGLSLTPARIHTGLNSGYQLIGWVYHQAASRIILTGYDMQRGPNGESHHHGDHEGRLPNLGTIDEWVRRMERLGADLRAQGVEVINATRRTAITCFERLPLEEALNSGSRCGCGGEAVLEYFDPVRRPIEWFMRCLSCQKIGPAAATESEAETLWRQAERVAA